MDLFGYTYKIYDIGYKTEMMSNECNAGDPIETPGGLYRGPPSNDNTIFKKMCMPNIKFKSVHTSAASPALDMSASVAFSYRNISASVMKWLSERMCISASPFPVLNTYEVISQMRMA